MFDIRRRHIHILSIYAQAAIDVHSSETMSLHERLSSIVVSLCSQAADPTHVNFTFRHAILCVAAADHLSFIKVNFLLV